LPGAFELTGDGHIVVCASIGDDIPTRSEMEELGRDVLPGETTTCKILRSAPAD